MSSEPSAAAMLHKYVAAELRQVCCGLILHILCEHGFCYFTLSIELSYHTLKLSVGCGQGIEQSTVSDLDLASLTIIRCKLKTFLLWSVFYN